MLTGTDLLAKVKELDDASKSDLVPSCGYVSSKKDGAERLNFTAFDEALLEAKGMNLGGGGGRGGRGRSGRQLSYATKVQFNGNLMVGKACTTQLGLGCPAMSSRSSWAANRSSSSPRGLQKRSERRVPAHEGPAVHGPLSPAERDNRHRSLRFSAYANHSSANTPL
ncbi:MULTISPECIES: AbrB-like transcriptional regulator [Aphanothece]|uniref:AbrB-like transcriptional regulator n=1 Tax=Aphanothece TaxID=1121 RepID=UPI003984A679